MTRVADVVDDFIDAHGTGPFTRTDLAGWVNANTSLYWTYDEASVALQTHRAANHAQPDGAGGFNKPHNPTRYVLRRQGMGPATTWELASPTGHGDLAAQAIVENLQRIRTDLNVRAMRVAQEDPVTAAAYVADAAFIDAGLALLEKVVSSMPSTVPTP